MLTFSSNYRPSLSAATPPCVWAIEKAICGNRINEPTGSELDTCQIKKTIVRYWRNNADPQTGTGYTTCGSMRREGPLYYPCLLKYYKILKINMPNLGDRLNEANRRYTMQRAVKYPFLSTVRTEAAGTSETPTPTSQSTSSYLP